MPKIIQLMTDYALAINFNLDALRNAVAQMPRSEYESWEY